VQRMLSTTADELARRSQLLAAAIATIAGWRVEIVAGVSAIGGGSGPGIELPTWLVAIHRDRLTPDALSARLRTLSPPIVARIDRDRVLLDLRTVLPEEDTALAALLATV
jgi:L-seryl-tRNA(Ser) seleniumtransferase